MLEIRRRSQQPAQMPTEGAQKPENGASMPRAHSDTAEAKPALKREIKPFVSMDKSKDYRAMYRAVFDYHERHNPPHVDRAYWATHRPGLDETPQAELDYWAQAAKDAEELTARFNDPFFTEMLVSVYVELEREYKAGRGEN